MMVPKDLPFVGPILEAGADDPAFDGLLLLGPPTIVAIVLLGRTLASTALAMAYIGTFVGYLLYKGLSETTVRQ